MVKYRSENFDFRFCSIFVVILFVKIVNTTLVFGGATSVVLTGVLFESRARIFCSRNRNKCLRLASEKFVLAIVNQTCH